MIISFCLFRYWDDRRQRPLLQDGKRTECSAEAVESVGAQVRAFVRDTAAIQIDRGSGRKAEHLDFLDSLAERELSLQFENKPTVRGAVPGSERVRPVDLGRIELRSKLVLLLTRPGTCLRRWPQLSRIHRLLRRPIRRNPARADAFQGFRRIARALTR